jgi:hypothetical protein
MLMLLGIQGVFFHLKGVLAQDLVAAHPNRVNNSHCRNTA